MGRRAGGQRATRRRVAGDQPAQRHRQAYRARRTAARGFTSRTSGQTRAVAGCDRAVRLPLLRTGSPVRRVAASARRSASHPHVHHGDPRRSLGSQLGCRQRTVRRAVLDVGCDGGAVRKRWRRARDPTTDERAGAHARRSRNAGGLARRARRHDVRWVLRERGRTIGVRPPTGLGRCVHAHGGSGGFDRADLAALCDRRVVDVAGDKPVDEGRG